MRHHRFESTAVRPVLAITFDDEWLGRGGPIRSVPFCERYFTVLGDWDPDVSRRRWTLCPVERVLIEFSDGTRGVCRPEDLADALAQYGITLGDD